MPSALADQWSQIQQQTPLGERRAVELIDALLRLAINCGASDIHMLPVADGGLNVLLRIDGALVRLGEVPEIGANLVARLKVMAQLLTYRTDAPQEGRLRSTATSTEMRLSTFPTLHGEKAVVRLFAGNQRYYQLADLGLPEEIQAALCERLLRGDGLTLVCGPSGSGKTTTLYAALRWLLDSAGPPRSISTLEDPIEAELPGVAQTQVRPGSELSYQRGLAALLRQDPEVLMVGEIRDRETAEIVFQASLTGHLVLSSFHAGDAAEALSRLAEMGIEPYVLRSGLQGVLAQQLLRRVCKCSSVEQNSRSCDQCGGAGYRGRFLIAELLAWDLPDLAAAVLRRAESQSLRAVARTAGMKSLRDRAASCIAAGWTTEAEVFRVLGPPSRDVDSTAR